MTWLKSEGSEACVKESGKEHNQQQGIGERFQEETKYFPDRMGGHYLDWDHKPECYKNYPEATPRIKLPEPGFRKDADFWETVLRRRSLRNYLCCRS
jgi:hypothetical protein